MDLNVSGQHIGYFRHEINFCSRKLSVKIARLETDIHRGECGNFIIFPRNDLKLSKVFTLKTRAMHKSDIAYGKKLPSIFA